MSRFVATTLRQYDTIVGSFKLEGSTYYGMSVKSRITLVMEHEASGERTKNSELSLSAKRSGGIIKWAGSAGRHRGIHQTSKQSTQHPIGLSVFTRSVKCFLAMQCSWTTLLCPYLCNYTPFLEIDRKSYVPKKLSIQPKAISRHPFGWESATQPVKTLTSKYLSTAVRARKLNQRTHR